jgi:hypothetical protein
MNPRDFDADITRIVDEVRAAGGTVTGIYIERADGQVLGRKPKDDAVVVSAERYLEMRRYGAGIVIGRKPKK